MRENSALSELAKKLEQNKKQELDQIKQIEAESISELAKSLKASLQKELSTIKDDILEMQTSINQNNKTLAENSKGYNKEIVQSFQSMSQELTKIKAKQWIIPTVMGLAIVLALMLGTWGTTKYLTHQLQALQELKEVIAQTEKTQDKYVIKSWNNAIGVKNEPKVYPQKGLWIVQFEKSN